ncbi:MAG TPA: hypothetical protein VKB78_01135, partial [Pirellulales bacterium]|nr:hypothetical protein [Pirellulales bacterium]
ANAMTIAIPTAGKNETKPFRMEFSNYTQIVTSFGLNDNHHANRRTRDLKAGRAVCRQRYSTLSRLIMMESACRHAHHRLSFVLRFPLNG